MNFQIDFSHIRNYSLEECISIFGGNQIQIQDHVLMVSGKIQGQVNVGFLKILQRQDNGNYKIGMYHAGNMDEYLEMEVPSLTYIRENIFQFQDQLSFERSTFLIVFKTITPVFIRLKCVRSILVRDYHSTANSNSSSSSSVLVGASVSSSTMKSLTKRTQSQFVKCMQQIYTSYVRDLQGSYKKEEILCMLEKDVHDYLKKFNELII